MKTTTMIASALVLAATAFTSCVGSRTAQQTLTFYGSQAGLPQAERDVIIAKVKDPHLAAAYFRGKADRLAGLRYIGGINYSMSAPYYSGGYIGLTVEEIDSVLTAEHNWRKATKTLYLQAVALSKKEFPAKKKR